MAEKKSASKIRWGWTGASLMALGMGLGLGGVAHAQEAAADDEIVVTGFRGSLQAAVDIKRREVAAVDAIVAEDIADFPDANLSESIQRIPGVAITRGGGEGRQISVRGLGAQFTRVRINGMEALTTTGSTDAEGGANRGRNFDFNIFASELFNNITVRKTATGDVEEGSLGATVDLRTSRPFDYDGFTLAVTGQGGYNDLSENFDPRLALLLSNTTDDGRFGVLFSIAYSGKEALEEGASTVRWQNNTNCGVTPANCFQSVAGDAAAVNAAFHPRIPRLDYYETTYDRLGITGSLQWRPTSSTDINLDVLYANHDGTRMESFIQAPVFSTNGASAIGAVDVTSYAIEGNSLVYGVFNDVDLRSEMRFDQLQTEFTQITLSAAHQFGDVFAISGYIGSSESEHDNPIQTTLLWDAVDADGYSYDYRGGRNIPAFNFGTVNVGSTAPWALSQIRLRPITVDNSYDTIKGDFDFTPNEWLSISGGVNATEYEYVTTELRRWNGSTNANIESSIPAFASGTSRANYVRYITSNGVTWAAPDVQAAALQWNLYDTSVFPMGFEPISGNNASITEETTGGYLQAGWDIDIGGRVPFRGNIGVRYVETELTSVGYTYNTVTNDPVLQTVEHSYDDALPSLNVAVEPVENFMIRFAAAQVMTRPALGNLNPGATVQRSGNNKSVTAGNPQLDPFRANAYDLAFEYYFADEGLISLALFYKDVTSFVQTLRQTGVYTGNALGLPDALAIAACSGAPVGTCSPSDSDWQFNQPINTPGGTLEGFEVSVQLPFFFLPGALSNFGVLANYTNVSSSFDTYGNGPGPAFPIIVVSAGDELTNLSPESWNATLYYDDGRLSARVSGAYRSEYITTIPGRNGNTSESTESTLNVDASASFMVNDNVTLTFEALNLTDQESDQILSPDGRPSFYHVYGTSYFMGFRLKL